jgi:hypothetical protein
MTIEEAEEVVAVDVEDKGNLVVEVDEEHVVTTPVTMAMDGILHRMVLMGNL